MTYRNASLYRLGVSICLTLVSFNFGVAQSVDLLTGQAQVSIPIWTLTYGDLSIPVSLYHHGNAVRVEEGEGAFGVGWNLAAGGAVSRTVRGLPDDYKVTDDNRKGWLIHDKADSIINFSPSSDDDLSNCSDEGDDYDFIDSKGYTIDTEPDMFYFSAPGLSGQFAFGADGNPKLLTYQDIGITVNRQNGNGKILSFSIVNDMGLTYLFSIIQSTARVVGQIQHESVSVFKTDWNYYKTEASFSSAWLLTSITSAATGRVASFTYQDLDETRSNRFVTLIGTVTNEPDTLYYITDRYMPKQLSSITAGAYGVDFSWYNGLIRKISAITTGGTETKDWEFVYGDVTSSTDTNYPRLYRHFLSAIRQTQNCEAFPSFSFVYEGVSLGTTIAVPIESGWKQDLFGFYNAYSDNKDVPLVYYYANESNERRFRTDIIASLTATDTLNGDNRSANPAAIGFGSLKEIKYPKGGSVKYTYEAAQYYDPSDSSVHYGPGVRVKSVSSFGGEAAYGKTSISAIDTAHSIQRDYKYLLDGDSTSSGLLTYPLAYAFADGSGFWRTVDPMGEPSQILYSRVREVISGHGSRVYEYELPGMYPLPDSVATKSKIARIGGCSAGNLKNGSYTFPFAPNPNFVRGFLKKQTEYSSSGAMVGQRRLYYTTQSISPDTVSGLKFERIDSGLHFSKYEIGTGTREVLSQEFTVAVGEESAADSTVVAVAYTYNSNHMLQTITTTSDDGTVTVEKIKYAKDYASLTGPTSDLPAVAIKALNNTRRHGEVIERYTTRTAAGDTVAKVINASLVLYKTFTNPVLTLPYKFLTWPQLSSGYTEAEAVGNSSFAYNSHYITTRTVDGYDSKGNVVSESDNHRNQIGYWTLPDYTLPPAGVISQAKCSQGAYAGFEPLLVSGPRFNPIGTGVTYGDPYAGVQSLQISNGGVYLRSDSIEKSGNRYRVSCWVKAAQNTTLTFVAKDGTGSDATGSSTPLVYNPSTMNQWVYLEGLMDVSNAPPKFTVELTGSASVWVDDVVCIPDYARVALTATRPLLGVTSQTDDRGNTVSYEYDQLGRKVKTYDRKHNLVERKDYLYASAAGKLTPAGFSSSTSDYATGQTTTFTSMANNCDDLSYSWSIYKNDETPVATSTNSSITYQFESPGAHNIKLTVNSMLYGSGTFVQNICVNLNPTIYTLSVTPSSTTFDCNSSVRTFSVAEEEPVGNFEYLWQVKIGINSEWVYLDHDVYYEYLIEYASPLQSYSMRCIINQTVPGIIQDASCPAYYGTTWITDAIPMNYDPQNCY